MCNPWRRLIFDLKFFDQYLDRMGKKKFVFPRRVAVVFLVYYKNGSSVVQKSAACTVPNLKNIPLPSLFLFICPSQPSIYQQHASVWRPEQHQWDQLSRNRCLGVALHQPAGVHPDHHHPGSRAKRFCPDGFLPAQEVVHRGWDLLEQPGGCRPAAALLPAILGCQHMERIRLALRPVPVQSGQPGHQDERLQQHLHPCSGQHRSVRRAGAHHVLRSNAEAQICQTRLPADVGLWFRLVHSHTHLQESERFP